MAKHWLIYNSVCFLLFDILYFEFRLFLDYIFHMKQKKRKTQDDHFRKVMESFLSLWGEWVDEPVVSHDEPGATDQDILSLCSSRISYHCVRLGYPIIVFVQNILSLCSTLGHPICVRLGYPIFVFVQDILSLCQTRISYHCVRLGYPIIVFDQDILSLCQTRISYHWVRLGYPIIVFDQDILSLYSIRISYHCV